MVGLLDDAAEHGDQWLAHARAKGDVTHEARALSLRMRIAFDVGDLPAWPASPTSSSPRSTRCPSDEDRARAMTYVAQSHRLLDRVAPTCEWADKALGHRHAQRVRRRAPRRDGREGLGARRSSPARPPRAEPSSRRPPRRPPAPATTRSPPRRSSRSCGWRGCRAASTTPALLVERMRKHAEVAGFDRLASYARVEATASLAAADGDLDAALEVLEQRRRDDPRTTSARNRRWLSVLRAGPGPRGRRPPARPPSSPRPPSR